MSSSCLLCAFNSSMHTKGNMLRITTKEDEEEIPSTPLIMDNRRSKLSSTCVICATADSTDTVGKWIREGHSGQVIFIFYPTQRRRGRTYTMIVLNVEYLSTFPKKPLKNSDQNLSKTIRKTKRISLLN